MITVSIVPSLQVQFATADQMLEELPMAQAVSPDRCTCLIPLPQPQQGNDFLLQDTGKKAPLT